MRRRRPAGRAPDADIVDQELWDTVRTKPMQNRVEPSNGGAAGDPSMLAGLLHDDQGNRMTPSHPVNNGKRYRYYVSRPLITGSKTTAPDGRRFPATEIERPVRPDPDRMIEHAFKSRSSLAFLVPNSSTTPYGFMPIVP